MELFVGLEDGKEIAGDNVKSRPFATCAHYPSDKDMVVVVSREQAEDLWKWLGATLYGLDVRVTRSVT